MDHVMVIDDDEALLELMGRVLSSEGYGVKMCWDPTAALAQLDAVDDKSIPKAIVLDISMPKMDGFTFLGRLMEDDRTRSIPVIIVTGKIKMFDLFKGQPNVVAFLEKPLKKSVLCDAVASAVKLPSGRNSPKGPPPQSSPPA